MWTQWTQWTERAILKDNLYPQYFTGKIGWASHPPHHKPHSFGEQSTQFTHFHVMLATDNSDFYEAPVPQGTFDTDVIEDTIRIDEEGFVHASTKLGLGFKVNEENLKKRAIKII